jgi:lipoyl(octanoyl) transferase
LWVPRSGGREDKIAAIGVRVRHWITYHGMSINLAPDLSHFTGIVPCGISQHGVTSLADLGKKATMADLDAALIETFPDVFGRTLDVKAQDGSVRTYAAGKDARQACPIGAPGSAVAV